MRPALYAPALGAGGGLPIDDWQFWVATGLFVFAAAWLLKGVLPVPILSGRHKRRKRERRATLTVGGKPLAKRK